MLNKPFEISTQDYIETVHIVYDKRQDEFDFGL